MGWVINGENLGGMIAIQFNGFEALQTFPRGFEQGFFPRPERKKGGGGVSLLGEGGGFGGAKKAAGEGENIGHGAQGFEINAEGPVVGEGDRHPIPRVGNVELEGMIGEEGLALGGRGDGVGWMAGVVVDQLAEAAAGEIKAVAIALLSIPLPPFPFSGG